MARRSIIFDFVVLAVVIGGMVGVYQTVAGNPLHPAIQKPNVEHNPTRTILAGGATVNITLELNVVEKSTGSFPPIGTLFHFLYQPYAGAPELEVGVCAIETAGLCRSTLVVPKKCNSGPCSYFFSFIKRDDTFLQHALAIGILNFDVVAAPVPPRKRAVNP